MHHQYAFNKIAIEKISFQKSCKFKLLPQFLKKKNMEKPFFVELVQRYQGKRKYKTHRSLKTNKTSASYWKYLEIYKEVKFYILILLIFNTNVFVK